MIRRPPRSTRTDTLFPYTTLFRSLYGLGMLPAGRTTILAFTMPLWLLPMSALVLHERLSGWKLAGLCIGLTGLGVLVGGRWEERRVGQACVRTCRSRWSQLP